MREDNRNHNAKFGKVQVVHTTDFAGLDMSTTFIIDEADLMLKNHVFRISDSNETSGLVMLR